MHRSGTTAAGFPSEATTPSSPLVPAILMGLVLFWRAGTGCHLPGHFQRPLAGNCSSTCFGKRPLTVGDGHAALIGLLLGMLLPATAPWWLVIIGHLPGHRHRHADLRRHRRQSLQPACPGLAILMRILGRPTWTSMPPTHQFRFSTSRPPDPYRPLMKAFGPDAVEPTSAWETCSSDDKSAASAATSGLALALGGST
jgi:hypothetical protein